MRRNTEAETVRWSAELPAEEYERFKTLLPMGGAFAATITLGLQTFVERLEAEPMLQVWAHNDLASHIYSEAKPARSHHLDVVIPTELYERFNLLIPEWGGATWFIRRLIASMNEVLKEDALPQQVNEAISQLLQAR